jgi:hypothetical protein
MHGGTMPINDPGIIAKMVFLLRYVYTKLYQKTAAAPIAIIKIFLENKRTKNPNNIKINAINITL